MNILYRSGTSHYGRVNSTHGVLDSWNPRGQPIAPSRVVNNVRPNVPPIPSVPRANSYEQPSRRPICVTGAP